MLQRPQETHKCTNAVHQLNGQATYFQDVAQQQHYTSGKNNTKNNSGIPLTAATILATFQL
jgi:hypothetical protein